MTWFLLALLLWRLAMIVLARTRAPIVTALLVGLSALFLDVGVNYQNILAFFPYFAVGHRMPRTLWRRHLLRPAVRIPCAVVFVLAAWLMVLFSVVGGAHFSRTFEKLSFTYSCFNGYPPEQRAAECSTGRELLRRTAFYLFSSPLVLGFLCIVPTRAGLWTLPGYMSMYVYLWHPLILFNPLVMHHTFEALSWMYGREVTVWNPASSGSAFAMLLPGAFLATAALSTPVARCLLRVLVEPPTDYLFKNREGAEEVSPARSPPPHGYNL